MVGCTPGGSVVVVVLVVVLILVVLVLVLSEESMVAPRIMVSLHPTSDRRQDRSPSRRREQRTHQMQHRRLPSGRDAGARRARLALRRRRPAVWRRVGAAAQAFAFVWRGVTAWWWSGWRRSRRRRCRRGKCRASARGGPGARVRGWRRPVLRTAWTRGGHETAA